MKTKPQIISQIHDLISDETGILEDAWRVEKEKRLAIIAARSMQIDELCREQENLLGLLSDYEAKKARLLVQLDLENQTLSSILLLAKNCHYDRLESFRDMATKYRLVSQSLKNEVNQNQELLIKTSQSIQRILSGFQQEVKSGSGPAYSPMHSIKKSGNASLLINASA